MFKILTQLSLETISFKYQITDSNGKRFFTNDISISNTTAHGSIGTSNINFRGVPSGITINNSEELPKETRRVKIYGGFTIEEDETA